MRRRALAPLAAAVLVLSGCSTSSADADLVDAYDEVVAQANVGDAQGLRSAVDAFIDLVHRQEATDALTPQEAQALLRTANVIKQRAGQVGQRATPSPTAPAPVVTQDDGEEERKRQEEERKRLEEERKRQEEERKRQEEERKRQQEQEQQQQSQQPQPQPTQEEPPPEPEPTVEATVEPVASPSGG